MFNRENLDTSKSYNRLIDTAELQELQDKFSEACGAFVACMDRDSGALTKFSGSKEERKQIETLLGMESYFQILTHSQSDAIEELIVEDTMYPNVKLAAITINIQGKNVALWIICGVLSDVPVPESEQEKFEVFKTKITTEHFYKSIELLRVISKKFFLMKYSAISASAESRRSRIAEKRMEEELRRNETMTEVVQLLESEMNMETLINTILQVVGKYLEVSSIGIIRVNLFEDDVDIISEWTAPGLIGYKVPIEKVPRRELPFLMEKTYTASVDSPIPENIRKVIEKYGIQSLVTMPIESNGKIIMYVMVTENRYQRTWDVSTIKFLNDVRKIIQSIVTKRITKNSLAGSYASLEEILEKVGCGIYVKDDVLGEILYVNEKIKSIFKENVYSKKFEEVFAQSELVNPEEKYYVLYYEEEGLWFDVQYTDIVWVDGRKVTLCTVYDITDKKLYQYKIEQQANNDFLTGLYNRMRCESDLSIQIKKVKASGSKGALLYIDLDDFKHINDGLGHHYGDVLLKSISSNLKGIRGLENSCYRMGGDEFVILVSPREIDNLERILVEIQMVFSKPWFLKGADYYCGMSMGVVVFPQDGEDVQDLIRKADIAMYEAKKSGKNRIIYYDDAYEESSYKRLDMEKNLRLATADGCKEFEVYFQPVIDIQKIGEQKCSGAEALVRWNNPMLGMVSPVDFIPLAEYLGLINPIGAYVLEQACLHCKKWNAMGHIDYKVNVNLSVVQLLQNDIVDVIKDVITKTKINPRNLTLEVTENLAINDMQRMKAILGQIKALGVRIALDDFGTGYSSLNHIKEIPLDVIKVDRCFVENIEFDDYSYAFVKMVAELASVMGVIICVEGVEELGQYEKLKELKVRLLQGYYFSKPLPAKVFEEKYL